MENDPRNKAYFLMLDYFQFGISALVLINGISDIMYRPQFSENQKVIISSAAFIALGMLGGIDALRKIRHDSK